MNQSMYLALDFPTWQEAKQFIERYQLTGVPVKVGMELFYQEGIHIIEKLKEDQHPIFLDLKLHDIPNTVKRAMINLGKLEVDMVNVHALGGSEMIAYAKEGLQIGNPNGTTKLIAVTILTSMDKRTIQRDLLIQKNVSDAVMHFASVAYHHGADGVVCSVHEAKQIKSAYGADFLTVTPGIRLSGSSADDQKRIATPDYARANGADCIVIGRSITKADDPSEAYKLAAKEWQNGKETRTSF